MAKYDPLTAYLAALPEEQHAIELSFSKVAVIVDGLPPSAYKLRQWWANDSKVQGRAWRAAGWHVDANGVDLNTQVVRFARGRVGGTYAQRLGLE